MIPSCQTWRAVQKSVNALAAHWYWRSYGLARQDEQGRDQSPEGEDLVGHIEDTNEGERLGGGCGPRINRIDTLHFGCLRQASSSVFTLLSNWSSC
ncbi:hypothetical protein BBD39_07810 [Arsenophonus endosymbiont of Bemisia tabaci Asia II 3]|nr:hypothetical protein BBD39_07810 [Arsenophonus endosymbiont of Bemisia tabaci Asia II 3]